MSPSSSLGCARNLIDSEVLLGHVTEQGFVIAPQPEDADVVVVNTCGFIEEAKQESIDAILDAVRLKQDGTLKGVVAVGCLTQRYADELQKELSEVDAILGISDYSGVPEVIRKVVNGSGTRFVPTVDGGKPKGARSDTGRVLLTPQSFAYLRISEGCDHACTFCAIPSMRGKNRSKPVDVLVEEARGIAARGVKELVIVAEDTTHYGIDLERRRMVHELIEQLANVDGIEWVRLIVRVSAHGAPRVDPSHARAPERGALPRYSDPAHQFQHAARDETRGVLGAGAGDHAPTAR